ncbi:hypothetical protein BJ322DRAFT_1017588 [Thelephora terrestris]|uniref:Uncharacterized protein n=1 Tax=Thelephora terrestris TaxID=56493 RepID=A0A9P6LB88_9AGAM|nr:hypothetical protein BJ322DRAFT_1017588 [Thelephora terrestris]
MSFIVIMSFIDIVLDLDYVNQDHCIRPFIGQACLAAQDHQMPSFRDSSFLPRASRYYDSSHLRPGRECVYSRLGLAVGLIDPKKTATRGLRNDSGSSFDANLRFLTANHRHPPRSSRHICALVVNVYTHVLDLTAFGQSRLDIPKPGTPTVNLAAARFGRVLYWESRLPLARLVGRVAADLVQSTQASAAFTENADAQFLACGWQVLHVGNGYLYIQQRPMCGADKLSLSEHRPSQDHDAILGRSMLKYGVRVRSGILLLGFAMWFHWFFDPKRRELRDTSARGPVGMTFRYSAGGPARSSGVGRTSSSIPCEVSEPEVSLGILTEAHVELINELPIECIPEALANVKKVSQDLDLEKWPIQDNDYLANVYGSLYSVLLGPIYQALELIPQLGASELKPYLHIPESSQDRRFLQRFDVDIQVRTTDAQEQVKISAEASYHRRFKELDSESARGQQGSTSTCRKIDVVALVVAVVEVVVPLFLMELDASSQRLWQDSMNGPTPDVPIEDPLSLYRRTRVMMDIYHAYCPKGDAEFDVGAFFGPSVRQWLVNTDDKTTQWVQAAIAADKVIPLDKAPDKALISRIRRLEWSDGYQEARFFTSLSKINACTPPAHFEPQPPRPHTTTYPTHIPPSSLLPTSCVSQVQPSSLPSPTLISPTSNPRPKRRTITPEMFPRPTDHLQPQRSSTWIEKAKQFTSQGENKKLEPFNFLPETCVKLNNADAARRLLDNMYSQMGADKIAEVRSKSPPVPDKRESEKFLFTAKVCLAEDYACERLDTDVGQ